MIDSREDILISRILDGDAASEVWSELAGLAAGDPALWQRMAESQRDHAALAHAVAESVACAERIELPVAGGMHQQHLPAQPPDRARPSAIGRLAFWSGWAAAATLALAWGIGLNGLLRARQSNTPTNGMTLAQKPDLSHLSTGDVLKAYLDKGQKDGVVVGELPEKVLLDARPAESGEGYDLLYLRQLLERTHVPDLYEFNGQDEQGRPTLVRSERRPGRSM